MAENFEHFIRISMTWHAHNVPKISISLQGVAILFCLVKRSYIINYVPSHLHFIKFKELVTQNILAEISFTLILLRIESS